MHRTCGGANDNASVLGGLSRIGGVYGMCVGGLRNNEGRARVWRREREACGPRVPYLHHKATSLVYQLVTSFYAGYQLVRRYQLVTRLVFGLVTGI